MKKTLILTGLLIITVILTIGCRSTDDEITNPMNNVFFKLDGVWQAYNFSPDYQFTEFLAHIRTTGEEIKGSIQSDCFGIFQANKLPFEITNGSYTDKDITMTFQMGTTSIIGHFRGNLKDNSKVIGGKEIVGFLTFEYSGMLTQTYSVHMVKQSIVYLPKTVAN